MRCEEAQVALSERAYGLERTPELQAHLAGCVACRELSQKHASLDRLLALDPPALPRPGFDTRFFERLRQEQAPGRETSKSWRLWPWALLPAAAALAAVIVLRVREPAPSELPAEDVELAMELELIEELDVATQLGQVEEPEDLELLTQIDDAELEALLAEPSP